MHARVKHPTIIQFLYLRLSHKNYFDYKDYKYVPFQFAETKFIANFQFRVSKRILVGGNLA